MRNGGDERPEWIPQSLQGSSFATWSGSFFIVVGVLGSYRFVPDIQKKNEALQQNLRNWRVLHAFLLFVALLPAQSELRRFWMCSSSILTNSTAPDTQVFHLS